MKLSEFKSIFDSGKPSPTKVTGLAGRLLRGMNAAAFDTLTDDPDRRVVFLVDASGVEACCGISGYELLEKIGWDPPYIQAKIKAGNKVKFCVFPETACKLGTWDNVLACVESEYPEVWGKISPHRTALSNMRIEDLPEIEKRLGFTFHEVEKAGKSDPRFMTIDRFKAARGTADEARAFLYFVAHLRELFTGDGYTRTRAGQRGVAEYILPNRPVAQLGEHVMLDVSVTLPTSDLHAIKLRTSQRGELPLPTFFDPQNAESYNYQPNFNALATDAWNWAQQHGIKPAGADTFRIMTLIIDAQKDFCHPTGSLYVGGQSQRGAIEDSARTAAFIYRNMKYLTGVTCTLDTHQANQIFVPSFWLDENGNHVPCFTQIATEDVIKGRVRPDPAVCRMLGENVSPSWLTAYAQHYCKSLEAAGKYTLMVWPFHCLLGTPGHALLGVVAEAHLFHAWARRTQSWDEVKGGNVLTENYSVLGPEVTKTHDSKVIGQANTTFLKTLLSYDAVIIGGQAASHCVKSSIDDLLENILKQDPKLAKKVHILTDCMSSVVTPVHDYTPDSQAALARFANAGMHLHKSTDPIQGWDGINL